MKYLMFVHKRTGQTYPVIFPEIDGLHHVEVKEAVREFLPSQAVVVSAGEITIERCSVHGESHSLNLKPGKDDAKIIEAQMV